MMHRRSTRGRGPLGALATALALSGALGLGCGDGCGAGTPGGESDDDADAAASPIYDLGTLPGIPRDAGGVTSGAGSGGDGAGGGGGAAGDGAGGDGASGSESEPLDAGGVAIVGGVLTNQPHLGFVDTGNQGLVITSAWLRVLEGSFNSVLLHGEVENRGTVTRCIPLFDVSFVGDVEVLAIVDAPAHDTGLSVADGCLAPGTKGAWNGIENEVPATLLEDATELRYAISGLERDYPPHPLSPTLISADTLVESELHSVAGQIRSASSAVYNVRITFYARNELGLLVDTANAYPLDLDTLPAHMTVDYRSGAFLFEPGQPQGLLHFFSFISGVAPAAVSSALVLDAPSEESARSRRVAEARAALAAAQRRLGGGH